MIARPVIFCTLFLTIVVFLASMKIKANQDNSSVPNNNLEVNPSKNPLDKTQKNGSTTIIFSSETKDPGKSSLDVNATATIADEIKVSANVVVPSVPEVNATAQVDGNETLAADNNATVSSEANASVPSVSFNASDFFSGFDVADLGDGAMGTQRLVEVKSGRLTPSLAFTMAYNYTSNPYSATIPLKQDAFNSVFSLLFNMGLGEYAVGDTLLTPALSLMQMRTYNDPVKDYGTELQVLDSDLQTAGLMLPILLPRDYSITLGHTYARALNFRNSDVLTYSNTPNLALAKMLPLPTGDALHITLSTSYTFSTGDPPSENPYYEMFKLLAVQQGKNIDSEQPLNLQQSWSHVFNLLYIMPVDEKLTLTPSVSLNMQQFDQGENKNREDMTYTAGLNASYLITQWMNVSAAANYTWKRTNDVGRKLPSPPQEFENFIGGVTLGFNYSF
jgi:hypothetical protein